MTRRPPINIRVVSASVRGTEIYRGETSNYDEGTWSHPELIAECQAALLRPTLTPIAPVAREEQHEQKTG